MSDKFDRDGIRDLDRRHREIEGITLDGPPSLDEPQFPTVGANQEPINWYRNELITPSGERMPALEEVDQRLLISTKVRTCQGTDSKCSDQCPLTNLTQEKFRGRSCPIELRKSWDTLVGFCKELQLGLKVGGDVDKIPSVDEIMEEITQIDLINEYIFWDLIAFRTHLELAQGSLVELVPTQGGAEILFQPQENPLLNIAERATNVKLKITKEFMTSRRGKIEAALKQASVNNVMHSYIASLGDHLAQIAQSEEEILAEFEREES